MIKHLKYILTAPKIGPDMYFTHWLLYFKPLRHWFTAWKLPNSHRLADIRPFVTINGTDNIFLAENVLLQPFTILSTYPGNLDSKITIEKDVVLALNVSIYSSTHNYKDIHTPLLKQGYNYAPVLIKSHAWIGVNVVILPGVTIGKHAVVGANSVVTKDVPDYCVAVGSPAKVIRNLNKENDK